MEGALRFPVPTLKTSYKRLRRFSEPLRRRVQGTLNREQLAGALADAGVVPGATVMTHVSMNDLMRTAPGINALDLIAMLRELLTEDGTLLVPTFPFTGFEADYLASSPSFDVQRTPSQMGLMTELFRRMPDTTRSLHPTHPVSGCGAHAADLLGTHHRGETFGELSPFCRMREYGGVVIGIGVGVSDAFTIAHSGEYLHPTARDYAFSLEPTVMSIQDGEKMIDYAFRPQRPRLDRRSRKTESALRKRGVLSYARHAGLLVSSASADAFIEETCRLISEGSYYDSFPPIGR
jgi:aminoglycoside N3'-acetyltransferase